MVGSNSSGKSHVCKIYMCEYISFILMLILDS